MTLGELVTKPPRKQAPPSIYVNPDDAKQTWSGRGRKPGWLKTWLDCGISLEDLRQPEVEGKHQGADAN
jgi:DNA-binding protein H-NS